MARPTPSNTQMSVKIRLTVSLVGMVVLAVLVLSSLHIHSQVSQALDHVRERSEGTADFIVSWIKHRANEMEPATEGRRPASLRQRWWSAIANDEELNEILARTLVSTTSIAEISIAGAEGKILASSNPARIGEVMRDRLTLQSLMQLGPVDRLLAIMGGRIDYESRAELTEDGKATSPVFTIQVLISSGLLRQELMPEIARMAVFTLGALIVSALLSFFVAQVAVHPLARISETIDRITAGEISLPAADRRTAREYAVVEQKLRLLGAQFRGAQEGASQLRSSMERRLVAINKLTGGVAHEIKNPLNSIAIRLELLKHHVKNNPEANEELGIISQEITRLDRVVRTFLDFTRPVDLATEELDLTSLAGEVLTLMDAEATASGVEIRFEHPPSPVKVKGDSDLLKQAILNVCRNSLDVMPDGGKLDVRLARNGSDALLTIADTGPGIPETEREKIFQLYYSTKHRGSGIGLAMTFRAVQLHGGTIEVGGKEGEGAEFRFRLPVAA